MYHDCTFHSSVHPIVPVHVAMGEIPQTSAVVVKSVNANVEVVNITNIMTSLQRRPSQVLIERTGTSYGPFLTAAVARQDACYSNSRDSAHASCHLPSVSRDCCWSGGCCGLGSFLAGLARRRRWAQFFKSSEMSDKIISFVWYHTCVHGIWYRAPAVHPQVGALMICMLQSWNTSLSPVTKSHTCSIYGQTVRNLIMCQLQLLLNYESWKYLQQFTSFWIYHFGL